MDSLLDNRTLNLIIKMLGVVVIYNEDLDGGGYYIPLTNTIVLNSNLDELGALLTLLHELGHASKHQENYRLYNLLFAWHSKMEHQADEFMLETLVSHHVNTPEFDLTNFNTVNFLDSYELDLSYIPLVEELVFRYV